MAIDTQTFPCRPACQGHVVPTADLAPEVARLEAMSPDERADDTRERYERSVARIDGWPDAAMEEIGGY